MKKVLFIDTTHPILEEELTNMEFLCESFPNYSKKDYQNCVHEYLGIIIRSKFRIDKEFIDKTKDLKFIARVGSGMENIDVEYAEKKGIKCINSPEGYRDAVAEQALGMLLSLFNKLNTADKEVRQGIWKREENRGLEIKDKTIGIIGYGNTGSAFAQRLSGFDAEVLAYDKYKSDFSDKFVKESSLDEIFLNADILSLHIPLTDETAFWIDDEFISKFKKNIFLINTSRGKILKTDELVENLKKGKVLGAALDVLEYEGLSFENIEKENMTASFNFLTKSEKVILTPHIAGWTKESKYRIAKIIAEKIGEVKI